ncbi:hypothetical protein [Aquibacillus salsiterrae]|uniref:Spore germination protein n=1 Tax=Aquibacillus salsiterrae TaxID=2950439 RepID=A0A9X3WEU0_9BACI|nr:hypothetical protein [Aquibacillus salsiterrae]MDC3417393.1 hypothetical protein [Aquibacillus salsiterrae]
MPETIIFNAINVNVQETNTGVFIGDNSASNWESHNKNLFSIGLLFGVLNTFPANLNVITDNDFIDTPIYNYDIQAPTTQI